MGKQVICLPRRCNESQISITKALELRYVSVQVNGMSLTTRKPASETKGFVFSTDDFASCFESSTRTDKDPFININDHSNGLLTFNGMNYVGREGKRQCYITVSVPDDKVLRFEMLDFNLPCTKATARIYNSTDINSMPYFPKLCGYISQRKRLIVPFNSAGIVLDIEIFSSVLVMSLRFSAVSNEGPQLQHTFIDATKGMSFLTKS